MVFYKFPLKFKITVLHKISATLEIILSISYPGVVRIHFHLAATQSYFRALLTFNR